jgi:hypothetical protein
MDTAAAQTKLSSDAWRASSAAGPWQDSLGDRIYPRPKVASDTTWHHSNSGHGGIGGNNAGQLDVRGYLTGDAPFRFRGQSASCHATSP